LLNNKTKTMQQDIRSMLKDKMLEISLGITPQERVDACKKLNLSRPTMDKYLSGDIAKIEPAEKIINHFSRIIKKRAASISKQVA